MLGELYVFGYVAISSSGYMDTQWISDLNGDG